MLSSTVTTPNMNPPCIFQFYEGMFKLASLYILPSGGHSTGPETNNALNTDLQMRLVAQCIVGLARDQRIDGFMLQNMPGPKTPEFGAFTRYLSEYGLTQGVPFDLSQLEKSWEQTKDTNSGTCALTANAKKLAITVAKKEAAFGLMQGRFNHYELYLISEDNGLPIYEIAGEFAGCHLYNIHAPSPSVKGEEKEIQAFMREKIESHAIVCGNLGAGDRLQINGCQSAIKNVDSTLYGFYDGLWVPWLQDKKVASGLSHSSDGTRRQELSEDKAVTSGQQQETPEEKASPQNAVASPTFFYNPNIESQPQPTAGSAPAATRGPYQ